MQSMIDSTAEENPPEGTKEHYTANKDQKETEIVKCTSDQPDPDPRSQLSEIVPSGSNATSGGREDTYLKCPNRRLTETTAKPALQSMGHRRW